MLALILIVFGVALRFLPHTPNVNPVAAIALFGATMLPNKRLVLIVPLALMITSDLFLGMHDIIVFTWGSVVLISLLGLSLKKCRRSTTILAGSVLSSVIFFVITNFGVWLSGWYPMTAAGLGQCFIAAIPFFRNFTASTLFYSCVLFGTYEIAARVVQNTKLAPALLNK
ncbi:MAG: DUF6580 family putative transport protein [Candidatus Omnitrophota bacterium]